MRWGEKIEIQKFPVSPLNCFGVNEAAYGRKSDNSYMK